jgi:flagellar capping protein FliD
MDMFEKTSYETGPVESPFDAICAFVEAYDVLQRILAEEGEEPTFADALRMAMYRPVRPDASKPPMSLYEIGAVYVPGEPGKYGVNNRKLKAALEQRESDVQELFVQENGILPHLCEMIPEFLENELPEEVHAAALRFLNECRRLMAMLA